MIAPDLLQELKCANRIADYADVLGVHNSPVSTRVASNHLGAVLADAVLQAGLSYRTVVRTRVQRIHLIFPEAATLAGLIALVETRGVADFLLWSHHTKTGRFLALIEFFTSQNVNDTLQLKAWLVSRGARDRLLEIHGIGPKTYDYLSCLVGIDCIAVDRHVRTFAIEAGVEVAEYERLKAVVSYAADLLDIARRDFDAWIWRTVSTRELDDRQMSLI